MLRALQGHFEEAELYETGPLHDLREVILMGEAVHSHEHSTR